MARRQRKRALAASSPRLIRVSNIEDTAHDYQHALDAAGIARAAQEEVFGLLATFRDKRSKEREFKDLSEASLKSLARQFLKKFGARIWGHDRKYLRAGLPNGGLRYTPGGPSGNTGTLVEILAPAFGDMRKRMFRPVEGSLGEDGGDEEVTSSDDERDQEGGGKSGKGGGEWKVEPAETEQDGNDGEEESGEGDAEWKVESAKKEDDGEDEREEEEAEEDEEDTGLTRRQRFKRKKSRLSRTLEFSDGEVSDEEEDSSGRLRRLERRRASRQGVDDDMPYGFNRSVQGVTEEQDRHIDQFMMQLDDVKATAPAMYQRFCLQVLRHYRDGKPI